MGMIMRQGPGSGGGKLNTKDEETDRVVQKNLLVLIKAVINAELVEQPKPQEN